MEKTSRYREVDIARGVGIILVVLGHVLGARMFVDFRFGLSAEQVQDASVRALSFIYSFHMQLFFFLSGFVSVKLLSLKWVGERMSFLGKKTVRLMVPYVVVAFLYTLAYQVLPEAARTDFTEASFYNLARGLNTSGALWYLYILFFYMLISVVLLYVPTLPVFLVISVVTFVLATWGQFEFITLIRLNTYYVFFLTGILVRKHYDSLKKYFTAELFGSSLLLFVFSNLMLLHYDDIDVLGVFKILAAFSGIFMVFSLGYLLKEKSVSKFLVLLGTYSMDIYILSEPIKVLLRYFNEQTGYSGFLPGAVMFFAALLLPIPISRLLLRSNPVGGFLILGILPGRKKRCKIRH